MRLCRSAQAPGSDRTESSRPLGAGGMGEVYRAPRSTRLGPGRRRSKPSPPPRGLEADARVARFEREAQILASLNHPHIAALYGLEEAAAGTRALPVGAVPRSSSSLRGRHPGRPDRARSGARRRREN